MFVRETNEWKPIWPETHTFKKKNYDHGNLSCTKYIYMNCIFSAILVEACCSDYLKRRHKKSTTVFGCYSSILMLSIKSLTCASYLCTEPQIVYYQLICYCQACFWVTVLSLQLLEWDQAQKHRGYIYLKVLHASYYIPTIAGEIWQPCILIQGKNIKC